MKVYSGVCIDGYLKGEYRNEPAQTFSFTRDLGRDNNGYMNVVFGTYHHHKGDWVIVKEETAIMPSR